MSISADAILKEIAAGKFRPVYLLHGDEPFFIDAITDALEDKVVPAESRGFCQFILYGADNQIGNVIQYARSYPFMSDRQLVLVKEAQKLGGIDREEGQKLLESYALNPLSTTVLVLAYQGKVDERKAFAKAIGKQGVLLKSAKMYDNKLPEWVGSYCRDRQVKISPKAIQMIVDNIGNDLKRIHNEIQKVLVNLAPGEAIDADEVERYIGISKEYNVFELQNALSRKDVKKATRIAAYFAANTKDNPVIPVVLILYAYFTKILLAHASPDKSDQALAAKLGVNPFFVKDYKSAMAHYSVAKLANIVSYLRDSDSKLKGIETGSRSEGDILNDLIFNILH
ncbi:DNA polymerase III subunit delta [Ravibacter arvi]|uniref:DNA polymerase III subunit delta n=1 Tax=Ravibacter arvi TaxID=2051041 RepID=A0ABP8LMT3_9BACT